MNMPLSSIAENQKRSIFDIQIGHWLVNDWRSHLIKKPQLEGFEVQRADDNQSLWSGVNDSAKTTEKISELNHEPVKANRRTVEGIRIDDLSMVFALDFFWSFQRALLFSIIWG